MNVHVLLGLVSEMVPWHLSLAKHELLQPILCTKMDSRIRQIFQCLRGRPFKTFPFVNKILTFLCFDIFADRMSNLWSTPYQFLWFRITNCRWASFWLALPTLETKFCICIVICVGQRHISHWRKGSFFFLERQTFHMITIYLFFLSTTRFRCIVHVCYFPCKRNVLFRKATW